MARVDRGKPSRDCRGSWRHSGGNRDCHQARLAPALVQRPRRSPGCAACGLDAGAGVLVLRARSARPRRPAAAESVAPEEGAVAPRPSLPRPAPAEEVPARLAIGPYSPRLEAVLEPPWRPLVNRSAAVVLCVAARRRVRDYAARAGIDL